MVRRVFEALGRVLPDQAPWPDDFDGFKLIFEGPRASRQVDRGEPSGCNRRLRIHWEWVVAMQWSDLIAQESDLRDWLISSQPADETRTNWWLSVVSAATNFLQSTLAADEPTDAANLELVVEVIDLAAEIGAISHVERAIRLANLAGLVVDAGRVSDVPSALTPDIAARKCLDLMPVDMLDVVSEARGWQMLPLDRIRRLRENKNLIGPVERLVSHIRDGSLASESVKWIAIRPQLP